MKIGILADTHDNLPAIAAGVRAFREQQVEAIVHAGDYIAPFALKAVLEIGVPVHGVFGNNDGEHAGLAQLMPDIAHGPKHLQLGGCKICVVHDESKITHEDLLASDIVVCGHTHSVKTESRNGCLWINPGECGGWLTGRCTVAILNTAGRTVDITRVYEQERP